MLVLYYYLFLFKIEIVHKRTYD